MELFNACSESPQLLDAVLSCVQHVVLIVDEDGHIVLANDMVEKVFGVTRQELTGKDLLTLFTTEDLPRLYPNLLFMAKKEKSFEGELTLVRNDGTRFFAYMVFRPYTEPEQDTHLTVACIYDIDKQKRAGQHVSDTHYDDLVKIADGIAHELRNPLVIIGGSAKRLYGSCAKAPDDQKYYDSILNNVIRLEGLVQKVEYFAHLPRPSMMKQSLRRLIQEALQPYLQQMEERQIRLANSVEDTSLFVDRNLVVRAFSILLDNACDALPDGGKITIHSETKNNLCQVTVADNGTGIHPEDLPYIFIPFYRTKPTGIGIDLAVVRQIMNSHSGSIDVRSEAGKQTEFKLSFPLEKRRSIRVSRMVNGEGTGK
jgi:PAS domain S-box-containing protein